MVTRVSLATAAWSFRSVCSNVLRLPPQGRLLVCTDLHGNACDFLRMEQLFVGARERFGEVYLLFTGDLIHGPSYQRQNWPDYLGDFYEDRSAEIVEHFIRLQQTYPARVHGLLGNHEHSHVGGPHTPKFWLDETDHLEQTIGTAKTKRLITLFRTFPMLALTECGVVVTHAAPDVQISSLADITSLRYEGHETMDFTRPKAMPLIGQLLWSRSCSAEVAREFLHAVGGGNKTYRVVVFGHDIVRSGYARNGAEQLQVSTSFGLKQSKKVYLHLDLSAKYASSADFVPGREILPLYYEDDEHAPDGADS